MENTCNRIVYVLILFIFCICTIVSYFMSMLLNKNDVSKNNSIVINKLNLFTHAAVTKLEETLEDNTLLHALNHIDLDMPLEFSDICNISVSNGEASRITLLKKININEKNKVENELSSIYGSYGINSTLWSIDGYIPENMWVTLLTHPVLPPLIGLIANTEKSRSNALELTISKGVPQAIDKVVLADKTNMGRILFYPFNNEDLIVAYIISYRSFFDRMSTDFYIQTGISILSIHIDSIEVLNHENHIHSDYFELCADSKSSSFCVRFDNNSILKTGLGSIHFIYGMTASILVLSILTILNRSRMIAISQLKFKSRFIAEISHEFRTPLNGILGMSELLETEYKDGMQREYISNIKSCCENLMIMINDILDMSKLEAGLLEIKPKRVNIQKSIYKTANSIWVSYNKRNGINNNILCLKLITYENISQYVCIDDDRVIQIISNLLTNALKFTKEGMISITIGCIESSGNSFLELCVSDTGCGISKDGLKRVFDAFHQEPSNKLDKFTKGTGLGLSICKNICTVMGGSISCSSKIGNGTSFFVKLPVKHLSELKIEKNVMVFDKTQILPYDAFDSNSSSDNMFSVLSEYHTSNAPTILIVDDVVLNRVIIDKFLISLSVNTDLCENGLDAVQLCETKTYSLILMDIYMPVMNGIDAATHIRKNDMNCKTPIVFVSASSHSGIMDTCRSLDITGFLRKPIRRNDIIDKLISFLKPDEVEWCRQHSVINSNL